MQKPGRYRLEFIATAENAKLVTGAFFLGWTSFDDLQLKILRQPALTPSYEQQHKIGMPKKKCPELTDEERAKRLKETARELEAEESGRAFQEAFK